MTDEVEDGLVHPALDIKTLEPKVGREGDVGINILDFCYISACCFCPAFSSPLGSLCFDGRSLDQGYFLGNLSAGTIPRTYLRRTYRNISPMLHCLHLPHELMRARFVAPLPQTQSSHRFGRQDI